MLEGEKPTGDINAKKPTEKKPNAYKFEDAVHLFPEAERDEAKELLSIQIRYMALFNSDREKFMEKYHSLNAFYGELLPEDKIEAQGISDRLRQTKIFHLFFGSSMQESWLTEFELYNHDDPNDPSYKFAKFIYGDFSKDLPKIEV